MAKAKKGTKKPAKKSASSAILTVSPVEVGKRVDAALALIAKARALLGPLEELSDDARQDSTGRFRDGESDAIRCVLAAADAFPELFVALAAKDRGKDDAKFETAPTRDDLARRDHVARLAVELGPLMRSAADTMLVLGARVRDVSSPTYGIARVAASVHPALRAKLGPALKFYGAPAVKAAKTRKSKKAAKGG